MEWKELISTKRFRSPTYENRSNFDARSEFERDLDRIIFSSAFRRLQDKTQVYPNPSSDFVHSRLTHSIEVAAIGRSLGRLAAKTIIRKEGELKDENSNNIREGDIGNIIAASCLAHDIGNPPFGHSGEKAIGRYFNELFRKDNYELNDVEQQDLIKYEGNASGFRILTNDHPSMVKGGLRLTYTTLATFTKYPRESKPTIEMNDLGTSVSDRHSQSKFGFFQQEKEILKEVADTCGLPKISDSDLAWVRHPLSFIMEAADTICYRCMDIEDAYKLGILKYKQTKNLLHSLTDNPDDPCKMSDILKIPNHDEQIGALRAKAVSALIYDAIKVFENNYEHIMKGEYDKELVDDMELLGKRLKSAKKISEQKIFSNEKILQMEIAGFKILGGLLGSFCDAVLDSKDTLSKKVLYLLPHQFKPKSDDSNYYKFLKISDYVCRMTDNYAIELYRRLEGHKLPSIE